MIAEDKAPCTPPTSNGLPTNQPPSLPPQHTQAKQIQQRNVLSYKPEQGMIAEEKAPCTPTNNGLPHSASNPKFDTPSPIKVAVVPSSNKAGHVDIPGDDGEDTAGEFETDYSLSRKVSR